MKAEFLNVDLEITSKSRLDLLAAEMGEKVFVLYSGFVGRHHMLTFESSMHYKSPDATIHALCSVVERLSPAARRIWDAAQKHFDIGYELRPSERMSRFSLKTATLQRVVSLGAALAVTYYQNDYPASNAAPTSRATRRWTVRKPRKGTSR